MGTLETPWLIAGAGIGGLTLAHGLAGAGRPFRIFEKDAGPQARDQGYRLHLDGTAVAALKECLNDAAFDAFWQLSEPLGNGFAFFDHRLRQLAYFPSRFYNASSPARVIARSTLRQLLLQMLPAEVEFDRAAKQFSVRDDGRVELQFEHGPSAVGSLLIGAEGSNAATARQLIPDQPLTDTGSLAVIGKVPTSEQILRWMPHGRFERLCIVLGPQDVNLFLSQHLPGHADDKTAAQTPQFADLLGPLPGFSVWAFMIRDEVFAGGGDPVQLPGATLKDTVQRRIAGWHPHLQQLVAAADPAHVTCTRMRSADHLSTWDTLPQVTLLGDALHTMTPLQGQGASAAVRDALALLQLLKQGPPSRDRLQRYEAAVVARVRPAVRSSRRTLAWAMTRRAQKAVFKWGIRVADAFTPG